MLKSNGLRHLKNPPVKFSFSLKIVPATIAKKLPPQRCFKPLFIAFFSLSHKRPTFAFTGESGYTLGFRRKIAHNGPHAETGAFRMGVVSLPSTHTARSQTSPGRVSERRTLPLLGLGRGCYQRTQRAFGTAMRSCASLPRGVAAPLGCVIQWVRYRCFPLTAIQTIVAVAGLPMTFATQFLSSAFDVDEPTVTQNIQCPLDAGT